MGYKEQEWSKLRRTGVKFELVVRDQDWRKLETNKFTLQNFTKIMRDIGNRYGLEKQDSKPNKELQNEMNWLKKEKII